MINRISELMLTADNPTRNWRLINRINQKQRRPEDAPVLLKDLTEEEKALIMKRYPGLFQREGIQPRSPALRPEKQSNQSIQ